MLEEVRACTQYAGLCWKVQLCVSVLDHFHLVYCAPLSVLTYIDV